VAKKTLQEARGQFRAGWSDAWASETTAEALPGEKDIWIKNADTDFALAPEGAFFWEPGQRQALARPTSGKLPGKEWTPPASASRSRTGGQLSRVSFYLHYGGAVLQHAGIRITGSPRLDGIKTTRRTQLVGSDRCVTTLETADGRLRVEIRTAMESGPVVAQEYVVTNIGASPIDYVRLSVYANLEADHSHENDYNLLDRELGALVTIDAASQVVCMLAGSEMPDSGWSGVWPSQEQLAKGTGPARSSWLAASDLPAMPGQHAVGSVEPPTDSLTAADAERVIEADWLLQAEGATLLVCAAEEIATARELADRIARRPSTPERSARLKQELQMELDELGRLEERLPVLQCPLHQEGSSFPRARRQRRWRR
jgi:hypothetical protein